MKRNILPYLMSGMFLCCALYASAWSQKGHDTTAYIAEQHLTPAAKAAVDSLFEGKSLVYWANWLDNASHTPEYAYTKTWHYLNVDADKTYETAPKNEKGDVVTAIRSMIAQLSSPDVPYAEKQLALKILTHVMGDLHQPLHLGHASDSGANSVRVKFFGQDKNLHSVWDGSIPESAHKWSYSEWQQQLDRATPTEEMLIISGNVDDWAKQTLAYATAIYDYFPAGKNISYNEVAYWTPVVEEQFLKGGLRLAYVLNMIFDPEYTSGTSITKTSDL